MRGLPEHDELERLLADAGPLVRVEQLTTVEVAGRRFPVLGLVLGSEDRSAPTFGLFGGVHGLERVGTATVLSYLRSLVALLRWDRGTQERLARSRVVSIPLLNPAGMALGRRSNGHGVDLMRNAPVDAQQRVPFPLGGHRMGPWLPWFRGPAGAPMEAEAQALVDFVRREVFEASSALTLDVHSGWGNRDQLWYPYARTEASFPRAMEARRLGTLLDATYPYHVYVIEPQSRNYVTHGDLWDHVFDLHAAQSPDRFLLPWTLEMGSWAWVRKNPRQLLTRGGVFNPVLPHRLQRVLRRHLLLIEFFQRLVDSGRWWEA